jgi:nitrogen regulatory protein PII
MERSLLLLLFIVMGIYAPYVYGAEEALITLNSLINEALSNNSQIQASYNSWKTAQFKVKQIRSLPDPWVSERKLRRGEGGLRDETSYVRTFVGNDVIHALKEMGTPRLTAIDVKAVGDEIAPEQLNISTELRSSYTTMVKLELVCTDKSIDKTIEVIQKKSQNW